jgi:hypothetical protein
VAGDLRVLVRAHRRSVPPRRSADDSADRLRGFRATVGSASARGAAGAGECGGVLRFVVSITATVALASAVTMLMHVALI